MLGGGELCACHLVTLLGVSQPTVSRHLGVLRRAGLIRERREGRWVHYRLARAAGLTRRILTAVAGWGREDPDVVRDRERAAGFRQLPPAAACCDDRTGETRS